jgi:hypothetical protein
MELIIVETSNKKALATHEIKPCNYKVSNGVVADKYRLVAY